MITPSDHRNSSPIEEENTVILRQNPKHQHEQNSDSTEGNQIVKDLTSPVNEINRLQIISDLKQESMLQQPRNRFGLLFTPTIDIPSPISEATPAQTPTHTRSKQESPFYAEPADALANNVLRRSQRGSLISKSQRHSEPPKGPIAIIKSKKLLSPIESQKISNISGSLDELKNKTVVKALRGGRLDPWPVDSSWEFMGNEDEHDYDTDANWETQPANLEASNEDTTSVQSTSKQEDRLTVNHIIAKRLPQLNISELLQKTSYPQSNTSEILLRNNTTATKSLNRRNRLSAYDNVERGAHSGYATSINFHDSSHSDDGTVFSEPWDSSQWDSYMPQDGKF